MVDFCVNSVAKTVHTATETRAEAPTRQQAEQLCKLIYQHADPSLWMQVIQHQSYRSTSRSEQRILAQAAFGRHEGNLPNCPRPQV